MKCYALASDGNISASVEVVQLPRDVDEKSVVASGNFARIARATHDGMLILLSFFSFWPLCIQQRNCLEAIDRNLLKGGI